jgi:hypothetical protein
VGVSGSSQNFEYVVFDGKERDIESSTSEIVDNDLRLGPAGSVKTVGWGSVRYKLLVERQDIPIAAAVGSLTIRRTVKPAMVPASLVAAR